MTDEALDSSRSVLSSPRGRGTKGLQQFFTPAPAAELIAAVNGHDLSTLDPTAGDGALLAPLAKEARFGIEIDPDQIAAGDYNAVQGDLQRVYPLLRRLGFRVPRIAANPPFGLDWDGPDGRESSTLATWRMCGGLLHPHGCGAFIAARDRFGREIAPRPDAKSVYALVECPDLFDGVSLPCVIAFFAATDSRLADQPRLELTATRDELPALAEQITDARDRCVRFVVTTDTARAHLAAHLRLVADEMERRRAQAAAQRPRFDLSLTGNRVRSRPSPLARLALAQPLGRLIERLDRQPVSYFALNGKEWRDLADAADEGVLTIDPALHAAVEQVAAEAQREVCPLYPVRPQQRLAFLDDLDTIPCRKTDEQRGFVAGQSYPLTTSSAVNVTHREKAATNRRGEVTIRRYEEEAKVLVVSIDGQRFDESAEDVAYLVEHFALPDPGDLATRFPADVGAAERLLDEIASAFGFEYKRFQRADLARLLVKGCGLCGWEQGLGKSLGGLSLIEACVRRGARRAGLIICPQDLIAQWQREARDFFGLDLPHIKTPAEARAVASHLEAGGEGVWITHFEALSLIGRRDEPLPHRMLRVRGEHGPVELDTAEHCPNCTADGYGGWQQRSALVCEACGYVHKRLVVKPAAHYLARAFADGVVVVDEGTLVKGDDSLRSKAVRGIRARHRFLLSGTPISNYVNDVFWLLWWVMGNATVRFPYSYEGGRAKFEADFCVIEYMMGTREKGTAHRRERRKVLPQVSNVSRLWRLLAGAMVRRRKEDTGEPIVPRTLKTISVPMGTAQQKLYEHWLSKQTFERHFAWKHPGHPLLEAGLVEKFAAGLGQLTKLEYATTLPEGDPDREWPGLDGFVHSNWTPKNLKVLELAVEHAQAGEKVLIGSDLIETGRWLTERLKERGVRAVHIVEQRDGRAATVNPRRRAQAISQFRHGTAQVLCCGIPSIRLGHNLDTASVVIANGLVFSYEMFDQFIARAHRLTSKQPVTIYVPLVAGSLDEKKWQLLCAKAQAADLALDGQLIPQREEPVSLETVLRDLQRAGIKPTGDEIDEAELQAAWHAHLPARTAASDLPPVVPLRSSEQLSLFGSIAA